MFTQTEPASRDELFFTVDLNSLRIDDCSTACAALLGYRLTTSCCRKLEQGHLLDAIPVQLIELAETGETLPPIRLQSKSGDIVASVRHLSLRPETLLVKLMPGYDSPGDTLVLDSDGYIEQTSGWLTQITTGFTTWFDLIAEPERKRIHTLVQHPDLPEHTILDYHIAGNDGVTRRIRHSLQVSGSPESRRLSGTVLELPAHAEEQRQLSTISLETGCPVRPGDQDASVVQRNFDALYQVISQLQKQVREDFHDATATLEAAVDYCHCSLCGERFRPALALVASDVSVTPFELGHLTRSDGSLFEVGGVNGWRQLMTRGHQAGLHMSLGTRGNGELILQSGEND